MYRSMVFIQREATRFGGGLALAGHVNVPAAIDLAHRGASVKPFMDATAQPFAQPRNDWTRNETPGMSSPIRPSIGVGLDHFEV
jgi:hypothetical protein